MGHTHAAAMAEYAKDAAETDKPWERWEFCLNNEREYTPLHKHPSWDANRKYRRKPKTILINGYEVPEPHRTPLKYDEEYWTPSLVCGATSLHWEDSYTDFVYLKKKRICTSHQRSSKKALQRTEKFHCSKGVNRGTRTQPKVKETSNESHF